MITNVNASETKSGVLYYKVSDHLPIFSVLGLSTERQMPRNCLKRTYGNEGKINFFEFMFEFAQRMLKDESMF